MSSQDSRINELKDSYKGDSSHKRKRYMREQKRSKSHGRVSLTKNVHTGNEANSLDLPPQIIGDDGNNQREKSYEAATTRCSGTLREKFARLRERQKEKIALCYRTSPIGNEPLWLKPLPVSYASGLVGNFPCRLNSCRSLSVLRPPRRFHLHQYNFAGKEPAFSWQPSSYVESTRPSASLSSQMLNRIEVPRGGNCHPWTGLGSNIASGSKLSRNSDSIAMEPAESNKTSDFQEMVTLWLQRELDSLSVGVRKLVEGNWADIMKDSSLYFSELISGQDLAQRWNIEGEKIPNPGDLSATGESDSTISE